MLSKTSIDPQSWIEWVGSFTDLDIYTLQPQFYPSAVISAPATTAGNTTGIQITEPFYCFAIGSYHWVSADGNAQALPYSIGFKVQNGNDWTNGTIPAPLVTGDVGRGGANPVQPVLSPWWPWARELAENEVVTVTVDNALAGTSNISVVACLYGIVTRIRKQPIDRSKM